jgi:hypothetical protein
LSVPPPKIKREAYKEYERIMNRRMSGRNFIPIRRLLCLDRHNEPHKSKNLSRNERSSDETAHKYHA